MSTITDIADAVVAELNGATEGTFGEAFTAQRLNLPEFDLKDMATLRVSVVPKGVQIAAASRLASQHDWQIDVGVQKKLSADGADQAEQDDLIALVEQIAAFLARRSLAAFPAAVWVKTELPTLYAPEHLRELRQFTSVLTLTYRTMS